MTLSGLCSHYWAWQFLNMVKFIAVPKREVVEGGKKESLYFVYFFLHLDHLLCIFRKRKVIKAMLPCFPFVGIQNWRLIQNLHESSHCVLEQERRANIRHQRCGILCFHLFIVYYYTRIFCVCAPVWREIIFPPLALMYVSVLAFKPFLLCYLHDLAFSGCHNQHLAQSLVEVL